MKVRSIVVTAALALMCGPALFSQMVRYRAGDSSPTNSEVCPFFELVNTTAAPINLTEYTLHYYYTKEGKTDESVSIAWATCGQSNLTSAIYPGYIEFGFTEEAGTLPPDKNVEGQVQVRKADWSQYNETNDYSYDAGAAGYNDWPRYTLYRNGILIWGTEPDGGKPAVTTDPLPVVETVAAQAPAAAETIVVDTAPEENKPAEIASVPIILNFAYDGPGTFRWEVDAIAGFINSWNAESIEVNGIDITNIFCAAPNLPGKINGKYHIRYSGSDPASHIEIRN